LTGPLEEDAPTHFGGRVGFDVKGAQLTDRLVIEVPGNDDIPRYRRSLVSDPDIEVDFSRATSTSTEANNELRSLSTAVIDRERYGDDRAE